VAPLSLSPQTEAAPKTNINVTPSPLQVQSAPAETQSSSDAAQAAAARGAAASAGASSAAATQAGQAQESAQANAMQQASSAAPQATSAPAPASSAPASTSGASSGQPQNGTPQTAQPPTSQPVTAPPNAGPSLDDMMAQYEQTAQDWMNGKVNQQVFQTAANRAILQMGQNNSAQMDALKMRINSDPSLAGQGAGSALLSMMAANQNFNADQLFGQLSQTAQQQILDMQKYGLQEGVAINQQRRQNAYAEVQALQDAGDFTGAAKILAKTVDFPGVSIDPSQFSASRARQTQDIQSLLTAGNYQGAAEKLAALTGMPVNPADLQKRDPYTLQQAMNLEQKGDFEGAAKQYAQAGINVTADDLRSQSPFMQQSWTNTLDAIKATATTNPAAAEAQLAILMKNPAAAKYLGFTADQNPHDLIQAIVSGQYAQDQQKIATLNTEINRQAKSNVPFAQALENYKQQGPVAWQGMTNTGKNMAKSDLDSFNQARAALGMDPVHKDAQGNIVDAQGTMLTDEDFAETAAAADYVSRKTQVNQQPWQAVYDQLMAPGSPFQQQILSIPGGDTMVKQALMTQYLGGGYKTDPNTGAMVPDFTNGMPWENPSTSYLFHAWPTAVFDANGQVQGKYDLGGDPYGMDMGGGQKVQKLPQDEQLDNAYAKYRYTGGTLNSTQWYFATAGGTKPPDATRIPDAVKTQGDNFQSVGQTGAPGTTGAGTTPATIDTSTPQAREDAFRNLLGSGAVAFSTPDQKQTFMQDMLTYRDIGNKLSPDKVGGVPDNGTTQALLQDADTWLKNHNIPASTISQNYDRSSVGGSGLTDTSHIAWDASQKGLDLALYIHMLNQGMKEADAQKALSYLVGDARANNAMSLLPSSASLSPAAANGMTTGGLSLGGLDFSNYKPQV
jgi:hypothetical protein